ncbi:MAG: ferrous iron transport protein A [Bacilli bacterium]|nr:ferrous iron transport protein A [Bacilli bacterium]
MTLADTQVGEISKILSIHHETEIKRRLYDLGFFPGSFIECVLISPFKSPILYKVNGALIALRASDAKKIEVAYEA